MEPGIPEWGFPLRAKNPQRSGNRLPYGEAGVPSGNPPNGNILVGGGGETNRDPLSRGDRKGESPNQTLMR